MDDLENLTQRAELCYATAYFIIPQYIQQNKERLLEELQTHKEVMAKSLYLTACKAGDQVPHEDDVVALTMHTVMLDTQHEAFIIAFPQFPPVNIQEYDSVDQIVLAPYFAAIIYNRTTNEMKYFILGQSLDAWTTLRKVTFTSNDNLGPGCQPDLEAFTKLLKRHV